MDDSRPQRFTVLELYVTGASPLSQRAIADLRHLCADHAEVDWYIRIIDVLEEPDKAEEARIVATPTLRRLVPAPERRVIGELSDQEQTLMALDLPLSVDGTG